ncbi:DUF6439 family protein [Lyngbya sp. PCC 8106]|jgi:hypothetical protein|uniref:DUF6439 family protein n=1 Tax=Lyngbya sp. (strain PCC 8106) TaxID=313612 RepID=UPI0000EACAFD|nr:DUF6439 family protein [Lyngbya sp. PCC 8106]EAW34184.1 hypothetical protein L8106_00190 [Lyngbya sp. PCC 8106]
MVNSIPKSTHNDQPANSSQTDRLDEYTTVELAQALAERLAISDQDWHQLKSNRQARASEQIIAALVFLLKKQPQEVIPRLNQAIGWLDRSISAPPCPTHGVHSSKKQS